LNLDINNLENTLFDFVDQIKILIAPETWANMLSNYSKNEMLVLVLLYRSPDVNMTQVSKEEVLSDQVYVYSRDKDIILL
jgi:hypothetical protein